MNFIFEGIITFAPSSFPSKCVAIVAQTQDQRLLTQKLTPCQDWVFNFAIGPIPLTKNVLKAKFELYN